MSCVSEHALKIDGHNTESDRTGSRCISSKTSSEQSESVMCLAKLSTKQEELELSFIHYTTNLLCMTCSHNTWLCTCGSHRVWEQHQLLICMFNAFPCWSLHSALWQTGPCWLVGGMTPAGVSAHKGLYCLQIVSRCLFVYRRTKCIFVFIESFLHMM